MEAIASTIQMEHGNDSCSVMTCSSNNAVNVNVTKVNIANVNYTITEFSRPLAASDVTFDIQFHDMTGM